MSIHNYLRPLWSNGPHVVHDAPPDVRTAFELLFRGKPRRQTDSIVQLHRVRPLDVTVAWLEVEVEIPVEGTGLSYRRARYLHAFATDGAATGGLTPGRARALFEDVYGEDLVAGIREAQRGLIGLDHPGHVARASALFVGDRHHRVRACDPHRAPGDEVPLAGREGPPATPGRGDIGQIDVATLASRPDPALFGARSEVSPGRAPATAEAASANPAVGVISDADLLREPVDPPAPPGRATPVEAFDRAFAVRARQSALPPGDEPAEAAAVPPLSEAPRPAAVADEPPVPAESASLSALLRTRLVRNPVVRESDDRSPPNRKNASAPGIVGSG